METCHLKDAESRNVAILIESVYIVGKRLNLTNAFAAMNDRNFFFLKINNDFRMFFLREILTSDYHVQVSRRPLLPKSTRHRLGKEP